LKRTQLQHEVQWARSYLSALLCQRQRLHEDFKSLLADKIDDNPIQVNAGLSVAWNLTYPGTLERMREAKSTFGFAGVISNFSIR
jgi:hypothetical protein